MLIDATYTFRSQIPALAPTARRSAAAILGAALTLPLAACGSHSFTEQAELTEVLEPRQASAYHTLIVDTGVGDIVVTGRDDVETITAEIKKIGKGSTPGAAQESLDAITIVFAPIAGEPGVFVCTSEFPKRWAGHAHQVEWNITAPSRLALDLLSDVGDATARRFDGGVSVRSDVGDVVLTDIHNGADVRSDVGDIVVRASGPIVALSDVGDIEVTVLDRGYGLSDLINLRSDVGDIEVSLPSHAMGMLNASTDTGDIDIDFKHSGSHEVLKFSRKHDTIKAVLNGNAEPSIEVHADVGDVEMAFYKAPR